MSKIHFPTLSLIFLSLLFVVPSFSQGLGGPPKFHVPVKWTETVEKAKAKLVMKGDTGKHFKIQQADNDTAYLVFTAKIDKGWHLYSQFVDAGGPIPTSFKFVPT